MLILEASIYGQEYIEFGCFCLFQKFAVLKSCEPGTKTPHLLMSFDRPYFQFKSHTYVVKNRRVPHGAAIPLSPSITARLESWESERIVPAKVVVPGRGAVDVIENCELAVFPWANES